MPLFFNGQLPYVSIGIKRKQATAAIGAPTGCDLNELGLVKHGLGAWP